MPLLSLSQIIPVFVPLVDYVSMIILYTSIDVSMQHSYDTVFIDIQCYAKILYCTSSLPIAQSLMHAVFC